MGKRRTGARSNLGEPYAGLLADFCEANRGAPEVRIIREAVQFFIDHELNAEPRLRDRFNAARERRLAAATAPVRSVKAPHSN
jgi:hypothetical protein